MTSTIVSVICGGDFGVPPDLFMVNHLNTMSPCEAYQVLLEQSTSDVIIYVHSDVKIHEPGWMTDVMAQFLLDDDVVAVGLGGATGLATKDLYRTPFNINNMQRVGYMSNQDDAETHGMRLTREMGAKRVAVLDAFFMAIRTNWLRSKGGWPVQHLTHHCMDLWLACEAARDEKKTMVVPVGCLHSGGGTSTKEAYKNAKWLQGYSMELDHLLPHQFLYQEYIDVLPIETL